jgi:hypothetical protein
MKINPLARVVRETTAPFEFTNDAGEVETADIRVRYFSRTVKEEKDRKSKLEAMDDNELYWMSEQLMDAGLCELPDLIDPKSKKPYKITVDVLDNFSAKNLRNIKKAIDDDITPKAQPVT